ncbi:MFS general substrate transporter [Saccharata proteae CBS 121410]|uniref:MFS general substrate transporter n=1 Tax=Saccharata proteae CBS 121410 TaxID=1314787 RepID=A0A9P4HMD1_9PEZI|nr:MFS general substrate transporter [Saccharata proteae CBS 121410]
METPGKSSNDSFKDGPALEDVELGKSSSALAWSVGAQEKTAAAEFDPWENDPENAYKWPLGKRIFHTAVPAGVMLVVCLASSIYVPAVEEIMEKFHVSSTIALLPYSFYVLGLGFGPMIASPCSELFGRKAVYISCGPVFALFILGSGFANSIAALAVCRFFAGLFGSPSLTVTSGTMADVWLPHERVLPSILTVTTPFLGPGLGPLIGGYVSQYKGWRWQAWVTLMFAAIFLTPAFFLHETYKKRILTQRAQRLGRASGLPSPPLSSTLKIFITVTLTRPIHMLFTEPIVGLFSLYVAFTFSVLYIFFAALPTILGLTYDFDLGAQGLTFASMIIGVLLGAAFMILAGLAAKRRTSASIAAGKPQLPLLPERHLAIAIPGSLLIPTGLFIFAWTARPNIHWIAPLIGEALFAMGNILVFMACLLYIVETYGPLYGASAMAGNTMLRYILGACFPLFARQMFGSLGVGWATSLLGFIALALGAVPLGFARWGPRLRGMSRYNDGR